VLYLFIITTFLANYFLGVLKKEMTSYKPAAMTGIKVVPINQVGLLDDIDCK
jgi:hypothetical protein